MQKTNIESRTIRFSQGVDRFLRQRLLVAVLGTTFLGFASIQPCLSQINPPAPTVESEVDEELRALEELIQETAEERAQLKQKLKRMSTKQSSTGNKTSGVRSMTRSLAYQIENEKQGFEERSKALRRKFAALKNRVGNMQNCADEVPPPAVDRDNRQQANSRQNSFPPGGDQRPSSDDNSKQVPNVIADIVRQDLPPSMNEQSMHQETDSSMLDQIKIMSGPIDRLSLANNLFASGNIDLALEVYKHIDPQTLTALDKSWLAYQIAGCHRLLGSRDKAERGYRVVTRESGNSMLGSQAKWWLESLDRESKLRTRKDRIQKSLVALRERFDEQTKSTAP